TPLLRHPRPAGRPDGAHRRTGPRRAPRLSTYAAVPPLRVTHLVERRHRLRPAPNPVQHLHPVAVEHRLPERLAALVLLQLEIQAGQLPDQDLERALAGAPLPVGQLEAVEPW